MEAGIDRYNHVAFLFGALRECLRNGGLSGGPARLQGLYNRAVTQPLDETSRILKGVIEEKNTPSVEPNGVPIFLFGNVLPDPQAFDLFASCGVRIVDEDLCTGSRVFAPIKMEKSEETLSQLARGILRRPRCARTLLTTQPGVLAAEVLARAAECKARGVIACSAKFCDPYIARLPGVRETLRKAGLPMLHIEGDCTMRSFGQQRTRIQAFTEMLRR
jgi:benzoyl-CoA reductase/2-hydroxyglutaryl-CoA dehydratase subunit BcrC/BadD/HgdB